MRNVATTLFVSLMVLVSISAGYFTAPGSVTAQSQQKTAGEAYKNIQVLKDIPADQLLTTMSFISGSLGVACNHCHVNPFDKDEKPTKLRAREMMLMMKKINQENFKGSLEVNCATCHQGKTIPPTTAPLARIDFNKALAPAAATAPPLPSVDEILDKYIQALGGKDALDKMTTLAMKGSRTDFNGPNPPSIINAEIYRKSPNKLMMVSITPGGTFTQAYNGSMAWFQNNNRVSEIHGADVLGAKRDADFFKNFALKTQFSTMTVVGREQLGDREAYVVQGAFTDTSPEKAMFGIQNERLYFDTKTGLLIRRAMDYGTPLGKLPEVTDFDDYRSVNGVMLPFTIRFSRPPFTNLQKFTEITVNGPLEDSKFNMPAPPPAAPAPKPTP